MSLLGPPVVPFSQLVWVFDSSTKIDVLKRVGTLILTSPQSSVADLFLVGLVVFVLIVPGWVERECPY